MDDYIADFHETEEASSLMYALGRLSIEWSFTEHLMATLIWRYVGDTQRGALITANLGNQSRADVLLGLTKDHEKDEAVRAFIAGMAKTFNKLRESRNTLMHSHSISKSRNAKPEWRRMAKSGRHVGVLADLADLSALVEKSAEISEACVQFSVFHTKREHGAPLPPLPEIPAPPNTLIQSPPVDHEDD